VASTFSSQHTLLTRHLTMLFRLDASRGLVVWHTATSGPESLLDIPGIVGLFVDKLCPTYTYTYII